MSCIAKIQTAHLLVLIATYWIDQSTTSNNSVSAGLVCNDGSNDIGNTSRYLKKAQPEDGAR
jgi:hypothetical protein